MKKAVAAVVTALLTIMLCVCMTACSTGIVGTYKFESMSMVSGGLSVEIKAGQEYMGVTVSEDAYKLEVKGDNTFVLSINMGTEANVEGTWEEKDGKYYFTAEGEEIEVTLDGSKVIFEQDGAKITLKK